MRNIDLSSDHYFSDIREYQQSSLTYTPLEHVSSDVLKMEHEVRVIDPLETNLFL